MAARAYKPEDFNPTAFAVLGVEEKAWKERYVK